MKLYPNALIQAIQTVINTGKIEIETYKDYSFFTLLNSLEIKLKPYYDSYRNRQDCMIEINNSDVTSQFIKDWKSTSVGKFFRKDYINDKRDFIGNTLYHCISLTIGETKIKVLVRLLNEITEDDIKESDKNDLIKTYGDLLIDGKYFSIIKIIDDNDVTTWGSWDKYKSRDNIIYSETYDANSYIDEESDTDNEANNIADEESSEPLF